MKNHSLFGLLAIVNLVSACSSGPTVRDTSHDDPKRIAEIAKLTSVPKRAIGLPGESQFSPTERFGWATYKVLDKKTNTTSVMEFQTLPAPGRAATRWIEVRNVSPEFATVIRMEMTKVSKPLGKTASGRPILQKVDRVIVWREGDAEAMEFPSEAAMANVWVGKLAPMMVDAVNAKSPRKRVTVTAGTSNCFVQHVDSIFLLREAEENCYSGQIPMPYLVQMESESRSQELLRYGFGSRHTFLPSKLKIVVNKSFAADEPKSAENRTTKPNLKKKAEELNPLKKIFGE